MLCSSLTALNCDNCTSNGLSCASCNSGFIYYNGQCINYVPVGYVNISGNATPCSSPCTTCSIATTNCTSCTNPLILYQFACISSSSCPSGTTLYNNTCTSCTNLCSQCSSTPSTCSSCSSPYFLNTVTHQCVTASNCQTYTYANSSNNQCSQCITPCLSCNTLVSCSSCVHGFYF